MRNLQLPWLGFFFFFLKKKKGQAPISTCNFSVRTVLKITTIHAYHFHFPFFTSDLQHRLSRSKHNDLINGTRRLATRNNCLRRRRRIPRRTTIVLRCPIHISLLHHFKPAPPSLNHQNPKQEQRNSLCTPCRGSSINHHNHILPNQLPKIPRHARKLNR